jgi:murein DD-endopeptidase MepM/ murein hydrolase activator NlpD
VAEGLASFPHLRAIPPCRAGALLLAALLLQGCAGRGPAAGGGIRADRAALSRVLSGLVWPLRFDRLRNVSSLYGYRAGGGGWGRYHYGLDLEARRGDPVYSVGDGVVEAVGESGAYGRSVRVDHGAGLASFYAHLDDVLARSGERVRRGQVIGRVGSTGNATGPHLHFELRWRDRWVDPLAVLPRLE